MAGLNKQPRHVYVDKNKGSPMIHKKYYHRLFVALMALGMTMVMSFTSTIISQGFSSQFLSAWLSAIILGFVVAFPTALIITPFARLVAEKLTTDN